MVLQEPFLFSGTVRENIKYNHVDVSEERMIEAAKAVDAHSFIIKLEDGYDTYLEERGENLSVGQRQLISFARSIVADPKILILDEATANIDSHTEAQIQLALRSLLRGRTAIVIAHRLSTIRGRRQDRRPQSRRASRRGHAQRAPRPRRAVLAPVPHELRRPRRDRRDVASPQRANPIRPHLASFPLGGKTKEAGYPRIQEGSMTGNLRASRHLDLEGAYNIRDIGGYETVDGRRTRPRTLFRSDSLHNLTPDSQRALVSEGLRTVVDLRVTESVSEHPNVFARSSEVDYRCVNVMGDEPLVEVSDIRVSALGPDRPPDIYAAIIDRRRSGWARSSSSSRLPVRSPRSTTATPVAIAPA
ncbi:Uncharacterized ABC transporter ATP-binding protein YknV [Geodia barretti]|uniref:Uncharacterized ABC transporter ATP-binding protein YknV n=1 Tax=Geodia barretti TaxID=519541 RepID=A0AA35T963_GEOBA|nr:Uncharacterized ABC transporter ATP-binding protein YknV [Geodia barretti]